jgi:5-methyltetrahydrofolate--homocysteine methyltransferase
MSDELIGFMTELKRDEALDEVKRMVDAGEDPLAILEALRQAMTLVGERFQAGEYFLAELILSGEILKRAMAVIEPSLRTTRPPDPLGRVVLATLRGDIHDLGKNIVATLLEARGFQVHDMGVDVDPALVVEKVREVNPDFVGFSVLITTAFDHMKEAADLLEEAGLRGQFKLMIGGGVTTAVVKDFVGADFRKP